MQKFSKVIITPKKKKSFMQVNFNKKSGNLTGQQWTDQWSRKSDQLMSRELSDAVDALKPHLMFASELIDESIKLDENMDYEKWFSEGHYNDDERFSNLTITGVQFFGTEALDAVKIFGYRETEKTDKPFKVKIETPVINLDRVKENRYALVVILDEQIDTLQQKIEGWLEKGETATQGEIAFIEESKLKKVG